jgi:hypothetical protein
MIDDLERGHDHTAMHKLGGHLDTHSRYLTEHTTREQREVILDFFLHIYPEREYFNEPEALVASLFGVTGRVDARDSE